MPSRLRPPFVASAVRPHNADTGHLMLKLERRAWGADVPWPRTRRAPPRAWTRPRQLAVRPVRRDGHETSVVSAFVEAVVVLLPSRAQGCSGSLVPTLAALVTCCSEMRADGRARGSEAMYEGDTVNGSVTWARRPCVSSCPCCPPGILNHNSQWWRKQDNLQNLSFKAQCTQAPSLFD